ncbi:MAG TPA: RHS repeat-associated core domain-containing protein, partial [Thermoanaerobaculia bacterium]|nr:RHS repeat-associated core domain-containing protein [Thermoanaerobaculia bacterium]
SGKELDEETGLSYFGARYYDARPGQWISADPILDQMLDPRRLQPAATQEPFWPSGQLYAYAGNSPTHLIDPTGLAKKKKKTVTAAAKTKKKASAKPKKALVKLGAVKVPISGKKKITPLQSSGRITSDFEPVGAQRRLTQVDAHVTRADLDTGTGTNQTTRSFVHSIGNSNDDAGHPIANRLGGPGNDVEFIFPQDPSTNRGVFRMHEAQVYEDVDTPGAADISLQFHYTGSSLRPDQITYDATILDTSGAVVTSYSETFDN